MKRVEAQKVGDIIREAVAQEGLSDKFNEQKLCAVWPQVVGYGINRYTSRRWVDRGVLHVYITSAPLKQELAFHKQSLIDALNEATGCGKVIFDIRFY